MGTTRTIMGVSRYLKRQDPTIQSVGCQPAEGSQIPGIRRWGRRSTCEDLEPARVDRIVAVTQHAAEETTRGLAREHGIFAGTSSGGAVWVARQLCRELDAASQAGVIVCIVCDRGDRYVSSPLYGGATKP